MGSQRDTDADWNHLGKTDPFWAVITDERFRAEQIDDAAREAFYASGQTNIRQFHVALQRYFAAPDRFEACLDFGSGLGRLLFPIASMADRAVGVDVAQSMRDLCQQRLNELDQAHVRLVANPIEAAAFGPFDWVNSYIVLQHIPPVRGLELIAQLVTSLKPSGFLSLHVTTFREPHLSHRETTGALRALLRQIRSRLFPNRDLGQITMYDYDLGQVLELLTRNGCPRFVLEHTNHGGHHGYMIYAQKQVDSSPP